MEKGTWLECFFEVADGLRYTNGMDGWMDEQGEGGVEQGEIQYLIEVQES